jgi:hypothetical protein
MRAAIAGKQINQADGDRTDTLSLQLIAAFTNPDNPNKILFINDP